MELLVLGLVVALGGVIWGLKRRGANKQASDLELVRDAVRYLARGYLDQGEDKAVEYAMSKLSPARIQQLAKLLGQHRLDSDAGVQVVRIWLSAQLHRVIQKMEGR